MLINLEFLDLGGTRVRMLPVELKNLKKLRVLLLGYGVRIPLGVLASLERLQEPVVMLSLLERWSAMKHLEVLRLLNLYDVVEVPANFHTRGQYHLGMLHKVYIDCCHTISHLTWIKYAPHLEILSVIACKSMEEVVKGDQDEEHEHEAIQLFSCLRVLTLIGLRKLKSIYNKALPFPSLRSIYIVECDSLRKLPLNNNSAKETLLQIKGHPTWWSNLEWEDPPNERLRSKFQLYF
ncbi:hypothetical protein PIB30_022771 [Stylosanthes scabra]|uniref:Disease resistance protein At4g27190-like leucine-rich repeats domain-containing protein n=1 Tax=Stylosanthes scabra TaxID=79078 RepID=A0ABU6S9Z9_9FABA|nr:hypothetical protein [Stylosanthes scabra]